MSSRKKNPMRRARGQRGPNPAPTRLLTRGGSRRVLPGRRRRGRPASGADSRMRVPGPWGWAGARTPCVSAGRCRPVLTWAAEPEPFEAARGAARLLRVLSSVHARRGGPALLPRPRPRPAGLAERPAREPRRPGGPGRPRARGRRCPRRWSPSSGSGWPTRSTARTSPSAATSPRPRGTPPKRRRRWAPGCWRSSFSSSAARRFSRLFRVSGWACEVTD